MARDYVRCNLPENDEYWKPPQFPGSPEARHLGCTCPVMQPWPGAFVFATDCPLHELEEKPTVQ